MILTKRMSNEILEALKSGGLDPATCNLADPIPDRQIVIPLPSMRAVELAKSRARITHLPTGSTFIFWRDSQHAFEFQGHMKVGKADFGGLTARPWSRLTQNIEDWAFEVRQEEADAPDLWAELHEVPEVLTAAQASDASNAPLTADEQAMIGSKLDEVRQLVRQQFELTSDQLAAIDRRLVDVQEASTRLGRKDWLLLLYGAAFNLVIADAIPPHIIQTILKTVVLGLAHIFGIGGTPPMITV